MKYKKYGRSVTIMLNEKIFQYIEEKCAELEIPISEWIREAISAKIKNEDSKLQTPSNQIGD